MRRKILALIACLAFVLGPPAYGDVIGQWTTAFGQGTIEYSIYADVSQKTYLTISDASNGFGDGVEVFFAIKGHGAKPGSPVVFTIGSVSIRMTANSGGSISTGCQSCARDFDALWILLRSGSSVRLSFDGRVADFTLRGAARILPRNPPPADYYR